MSSHKTRNIFVNTPITPAFVSEKIAAHAKETHIGGHSIFLGQVRADVIDGKTVSGIEYTTYEEMALEVMNEIRQDIFDRYELSCMHVYHSLGVVKTGEISLFVFTSSRHRGPAVKACEECVERIKKELPVWGKELFTDQTHTWKVNN